MQVSIESGEGLERRMTVELPAEQVDAEVTKRLKDLSRSVKLHGFRPGKVPLTVVRQRFGSRVRSEVFGEMVQSSFFDAVAQENLKPAGEPRIEAKRDDAQGYGYTAVFEVLPEIELASMEHISIQRPSAEIKDADVATMIEKLRRQRTTWNQVDRGAAEGDMVRVSFRGSVDGEPFEGGEADDVPLVIGSKRMIAGFEDGLVGAVAGDQRTLNLQFPEDYRVEKLAGKQVSFDVAVSSVAEPVLPEIDEEFLRSLGIGEGGVEALQQDVRKNMERELEQKIRSVLKDRVMDALLEANTVAIPKVMVGREARRLQDQARQEVRSSGGAGKFELPLGLFEEQAKRRVALGLLIAEVVRHNNIKVDPERVRRTVADFAASYEQPDEVVKWYYNDQEQLAAVESVVLEDQVVDWVLEQADVEERPAEFDALMETG